MAKHFDHYLLDAETPAQRLAWMLCTDMGWGIDEDHMAHFSSEFLTANEVLAFGKNVANLVKRLGRGTVSENEVATEAAKLFARYWMENGAMVFPDSKELAKGKVSFKVSSIV